MNTIAKNRVKTITVTILLGAALALGTTNYAHADDAPTYTASYHLNCVPEHGSELFEVFLASTGPAHQAQVSATVEGMTGQGAGALSLSSAPAEFLRMVFPAHESPDVTVYVDGVAVSAIVLDGSSCTAVTVVAPPVSHLTKAKTTESHPVISAVHVAPPQPIVWNGSQIVAQAELASGQIS